MKAKLPTIDNTLSVGTYVKLLKLKSYDSLYKDESNYIDSIYVIGSKETKVPQANLQINTKSEFRLEKGYYSGPLINVNTGNDVYVGSAIVEKVLVKEPQDGNLHIPEGTQILLSTVPGLQSTCVGKIAIVGAGGLHRNFPAVPDSYGGNISINGESFSLYGLKFKIVENPNTADKINCIYPDCKEHPWKGLDVCETHAEHYIQKQWTPCEIDECEKHASAQHNNQRCASHGGTDLKKQIYEIKSLSGVYVNLGSVHNSINWPNSNLKLETSSSHWGSWRPTVGQKGELVWRTYYKIGNTEILILKIDGHFVAIDAKHVSLIEEHAMAVGTEQSQKLEQERLALLKMKDILIKKVMDLYDEEETKLVPPTVKTNDAKTNTVQPTSNTPTPTAPANTKTNSVANGVGTFKNKTEFENVAGNTALNSQEALMPESMKDKVIKTARRNSKQAAIRLAGRQFTKAAQKPLVAFLAGNLSDDSPAARKRIALFLDTDVGKSLVSLLLSAGLSAVPDGVGGDLPDQLADELRVEAMTNIGDVVADVIMAPLREVLSSYVAPDLTRHETPALEVQAQPLVKEVISEIDIEVENPVPYKSR